MGEIFVVESHVLPGTENTAAQFEARGDVTPRATSLPVYARGVGVISSYLTMQRFEVPIATAPHHDEQRAEAGITGILYMAARKLPDWFTGDVVVRSEFEVVQRVMAKIEARTIELPGVYHLSKAAMWSELEHKYPYLLRSRSF